MRKLVLASLCFSLFTSLALAKELFFATGPDGGLFRVFPSGISACLNQNQDEHTFARSTRVESGTTGILTPLHTGAASFWKNQ